MISQTRQWFAMAGMIGLAVLALILGAIYQDDDKLDEPNIVGGGATPATAQSAGGSAGADPGQAGEVNSAGPIERFLPLSGEASACREEVGVDLAAGFGAKLTINGIEIAPEAMNVNLDPDGKISKVITASRSLGQYTFSPDDTCPSGRFLRPVDNLLEVCVFRLEDVTQACAVKTEHVFDAL